MSRPYMACISSEERSACARTTVAFRVGGSVFRVDPSPHGATVTVGLSRSLADRQGRLSLRPSGVCLSSAHTSTSSPPAISAARPAISRSRTASASAASSLLAL